MANPEAVLTSIERGIGQMLPGSIRRLPVFGSYGLGIAVPGGGLVAVAADREDPWFLNVSAGLAADCPNLGGALAWVNSKNSDHRFGRYYASIPAEGSVRTNVVYQVNIFSVMLDMASSLESGWVPEMVKLCCEISSREQAEATGVVGGRPFSDNYDDLTTLVAASFG